MNSMTLPSTLVLIDYVHIIVDEPLVYHSKLRDLISSI